MLVVVVTTSHRTAPHLTELFDRVASKCCERLVEVCDEMQGDSDDARAETHRLIHTLTATLRSLDQHTDGIITAEFLTHILSMMEEEMREGEGDEEQQEEES